MKIVKNIKLIIIAIFTFIIIFGLLGYFNFFNFKEGATSDVPRCMNSDVDPDDADQEDDYFLSTTLVPPVCPTCPYYEPSNLTGGTASRGTSYSDISGAYRSGSGGILDGVFGSTGSGDITRSNNNNRVNVSANTTNDNDINYSNKQDVLQQSQVNKINTNNSTNTATDNSLDSTQINQDSSVNQDMSQTQTQTTTQTSDSKFNNLLGNNSIMFGSFGGGGSGSNTQNVNGGLLPVSSPESVSSSSLTPYDKIKTTDPETISMINDMKATITKLNQQAQKDKATCPPCPACERCPEPAFECKKVPNYRSPSIDNYMPVPVLNDFSKF